MDGRSDAATAAVSAYLEPGEVLREAVAGYSYLGFRRLIVGITDRRVLAVRSGYWAVKNKRLLWADPLDDVKIRGKVRIKNGNGSMFFRRSDNKSFVFNPRSGWVSGNARENAKKLSDLLVTF